MKKIFYLLIFELIIQIYPAHSVSAQDLKALCRQEMRFPEVKISTSYGKLRYDFSKSKKALTRLNIKTYGASSTPGREVHGLAIYNLVLDLDFIMTKRNLRNGVVCAYPSEINLKIGLKDPVIYIAKTLEPGSCSYNITMRHEQTHQQITTEVLETYLPIIQEKFLQTVREHSIAADTQDFSTTLAKDSLKQHYLNVLNPLLEEIKEEIKAEQSKLDNIEHYDYEASLCDD